MNEIQLKKAKVQDLPKIINLRLSLWKEIGKIRSDYELNKMFEINYKYLESNLQSDTMIIFFYENQSTLEIVSTGMGVVIHKPPINLDNPGSEGYIFNMSTKEEYQKRGYGTQIIKAIINFFKENNVSKASLISNENSYIFYKKNGFKDNIYYQEIIF